MKTETARRGIGGRIRDLRLFWKLLIPFLVLVLLVGAAGTFLIVRELSARTQHDLDDRLIVHMQNAKNGLLDQDAYVRDSANFAANLQGMAAAVRASDIAAVDALTGSVRAFRDQLNLLVVTDRSGAGLMEVRGDSIRRGTIVRGRKWSAEPIVQQALAGNGFIAGFVFVPGQGTELGVAAPILERRKAVVGAALAAIRLDRLTARIAESLRTPGERSSPRDVRIYDATGTLLAGSGLQRVPTDLAARGPERRVERRGSTRTFVLYSPLLVAGSRVGTLAVSLPGESALGAVGGALVPLVLLLVVAMAAVLGLGALLSRFILAQVKPLLATNRELARGELGARAPVLGHDEIGELAEGFNHMATELQAIYRDLERRVAERTEELSHLNEELRRTYQAQSDFFSQMSHELRSPLFLISGNTQMLLDPEMGPTGRRQREELLKTINEASDYLTEVINEILDFKRLEAGRLPVEPSELDVAGMLGELRGTMHSLARRAGQELAFDVPADLPRVVADPTHLNRILRNLISNAVKYTPAGGKVRVSAKVVSGQVEIAVADTGVGIPKHAGDRIFEPFFQVEGTKALHGEASSGLGLALTKQLVDAQSGRLWYESKPGRGTVFRFTLPVADRDVAAGVTD